MLAVRLRGSRVSLLRDLNFFVYVHNVLGIYTYCLFLFSPFFCFNSSEKKKNNDFKKYAFMFVMCTSFYL